MKNSFLKICSSVFFIFMIVAGCNSSTEKKAEDLENAEKNVVDAQKDLDLSRQDSTREYEQYKADVASKLLENDRKILQLKEKMTVAKTKANDKYTSELKELEVKNLKLRTKMEGYKNGAKENWESFKYDFNKELDEIGKSISAFAQKNK
jgi:hypothetical protein